MAQTKGADLVVVGSRSHNFLYEVFLGSVAKDVIRKSDLPVLIARLEAAKAGQSDTCAAIFGRALDRILLATDLSAQSRSAEDAAVRLAGKAGHIDCLTVLADDASEAEQEAVETKHQNLIRRIKDAGGKAGSRVAKGNPSEIISRIGQEGYSLIMVGKHGRNWVANKIIGSTAAKVCEIARRPVLMMPLQKE